MQTDFKIPLPPNRFDATARIRFIGTITAKVERFGSLALRFFNDIQPFLFDADNKLRDNGDFDAVRNFLLKSLVSTRVTSTERILDEEVELAYIDLYGYDPRLQELVVTAIRLLTQTEKEIHVHTLAKTLEDVNKLELEKQVQELRINLLVNTLRRSYGQLAQDGEVKISRIITPFRKEMIKLMEASDEQIVEKGVIFSVLRDLFSETI